MQFAVIGAGAIGAGWVARFLLMGFDVKIFDPNPNAQRIIEQTLINARRSMPGLYDYMLPTEGKYCFCESIAETVTNVDWISNRFTKTIFTLSGQHIVIKSWHRPSCIN
jgi:carnitine 3-dehydrogenase